MEKKATTVNKKATATKVAAKATATKVTTAQKKLAAKRNISKGQKLACEVCGISVAVEEIGGVVVEEENVPLCCGKPMKAKAAVKKTVKK